MGDGPLLSRQGRGNETGAVPETREATGTLRTPTARSRQGRGNETGAVPEAREATGTLRTPTARCGQKRLFQGHPKFCRSHVKLRRLQLPGFK